MAESRRGLGLVAVIGGMEVMLGRGSNCDTGTAWLPASPRAEGGLLLRAKMDGVLGRAGISDTDVSDDLGLNILEGD